MLYRSVLNLFWLKGTKYNDKKYNIEQTKPPNIKIGNTILKFDKPALAKIKSSDSEISLWIAYIVAAKADIGKTISITCGKIRIEIFIKTSPDWPLEITSSNLGIDWISHRIPTKTKEKKIKDLLCWVNIYLSNVFNKFPSLIV